MTVGLDGLMDAGHPEQPYSRGRAAAGGLVLTAVLTAFLAAIVVAIVGGAALGAFLLWFRL
jgi:hypothetical protein